MFILLSIITFKSTIYIYMFVISIRILENEINKKVIEIQIERGNVLLLICILKKEKTNTKAKNKTGKQQT